jgi:hypothetical protein
MYENTAILRKDGTPTYGRRRFPEGSLSGRTCVLYAVNDVAGHDIELGLPGSERTSSSGCKASAGKRFSLI